MHPVHHPLTVWQRIALCFATLFFSVLALTACGGGADGGTGGDASSQQPISIEKSRLDLEGDLGGGQVIAEFTYSAPGATVLGLSTSTGEAVPSWIDIFYGNGTIRVVANPTSPLPGIYSAPLRIHAVDAAGKSLGFKDLSVSFSVRGLKVDQTQVTYDPTVPGTKLVDLMVNTGSQTWNLTSNVPWMTFNRTTVTGLQTVQMVIDGAGQTGSSWANVNADRSGQNVFTTRMNLTVTNIMWSIRNSEYNWSPHAMRGWTTPSKTFELSYTGGTPVPVTITSNAAWLKVPAQLMSNESFTATVEPDASLKASNNLGTITLTSTAGTQTLRLQVSVSPTVDELGLSLWPSNASLSFLSSAGSVPPKQNISLLRSGTIDSRYPAVITAESSVPWLVLDAAGLGAVLGQSQAGVSIATHHGLAVGTHTAQVTIRGTSGTHTVTPMIVPVTFRVQ